MNKILLNKNGRNHIRIMPLNGIIELPTENTSTFCEELFNILNLWKFTNINKGGI